MIHFLLGLLREQAELLLLRADEDLEPLVALEDDLPGEEGDVRDLARDGQADLFAGAGRAPEPAPAADPLRDALQAVNPDELSPREALELLYRLKQLD